MEVPQAFIEECLANFIGLHSSLLNHGLYVVGSNEFITKLESMICKECDGSGMIPHTNGSCGYSVCRNRACQGHQKVQAYWKGVAATPPGL